MRGYRDDERRSGGFELAGFLCVVLATAIALFLYSGKTEEVARVRFIDPVHADRSVSDETTTAVPGTGIVLPPAAPTPAARPESRGLPD